MTLLAVLTGAFSDITNSGTAKAIVSALGEAMQLFWEEEEGCSDRRLLTNHPRMPELLSS